MISRTHGHGCEIATLGRRTNGCQASAKPSSLLGRCLKRIRLHRNRRPSVCRSGAFSTVGRSAGGYTTPSSTGRCRCFMSGMAVGATGDPDRGKFRIHVKGGHKAGAKDTAVPRQITPDEAVHRRRVLDKVTKPVLRRSHAHGARTPGRSLRCRRSRSSQCRRHGCVCKLNVDLNGR